MGSLFDDKYSQWSNRFLPITEVYLEPSQISTMEFFCKIRTDLQSLFSVKLSVTQKLSLCYTITISPQSKGINWIADQHKSSNSFGFK